jgi:hypothetical protein
MFDTLLKFETPRLGFILFVTILFFLHRFRLKIQCFFGAVFYICHTPLFIVMVNLP